MVELVNTAGWVIAHQHIMRAWAALASSSLAIRAIIIV